MSGISISEIAWVKVLWLEWYFKPALRRPREEFRLGSQEL